MALGDVLAAYVERGQGVVVASGALQSGTAIGGAFVEQGYLPVTVGTRAEGPPELPIAQLPGFEWLVGPISGHPSVYGVNVLFGGPTSTRAVDLVARPGADVTAAWADGTPAIVVRVHHVMDGGGTSGTGERPSHLWTVPGRRRAGLRAGPHGSAAHRSPSCLRTLPIRIPRGPCSPRGLRALSA